MSHPYIHIRKLEGCLGFSRQAYYQYWKRQNKQIDHETQIVSLVNVIRKDHPKMGGRKLYALLKEELTKRGIKMSRDALFEAQEINNRYFRVERSADGKSFEEIGRVTGRNQTRLISSYQFADTRPLPGHSYYRVTQVDWDGLETFTNIASVLVEQNQYSNLSPNPATDQATLTFFSAQAQPVTISVTDGQGKLVLSRQLTKASGMFEWTLPLDEFASGVYLVHLQAGTYQKSLKFVKH